MRWLGKYGEAIYDTRPWLVFGEGPTRLKQGGGFVHRQGGYLEYTPRDIRYTRKGGTIYAVMLGTPTAGKDVLLTSFAKDKLQGDLAVSKVTLVGSGAEVKFASRR